MWRSGWVNILQRDVGAAAAMLGLTKPKVVVEFWAFSVGLTWQPSGSPLPVCGWWQSAGAPNSWKWRSVRAARCSGCSDALAVGGRRVRLWTGTALGWLRGPHLPGIGSDSANWKPWFGKEPEVRASADGREPALETQRRGRGGRSREVQQRVYRVRVEHGGQVWTCLKTCWEKGFLRTLLRLLFSLLCTSLTSIIVMFQKNI